MPKKIFFVSSNATWGGSEILWSEAALKMIDLGYEVQFGVKYRQPVLQSLISKGAKYVDLNNTLPSLSYLQRILRKIKIRQPEEEVFSRVIAQERPQVVIISQGNNFDGNYYMTVCKVLNVPFITVTQLVAEVLYMFINDEIIDQLRGNYKESEMNYFVSQQNVDIHNEMIGETFSNTKVIFNPFTVGEDNRLDYPEVENDVYHIALVGRLDVYHKGQDLLLSVLRQQKWRTRTAIFHFYGDGPHKSLLVRLVDSYGLKNIRFEGHVHDVETIWKLNHLMILPSRMEGQSLALNEAMWCNRAAIVTDVGGARELITEGDTGYIADFATVSHLDNELEKAWAARGSWRELGIRAGNKIRKLYSTSPIDHFVQEVEEVLSRSKA